MRSYGAQDALVMAVRNGEVNAMYDYSSPIEPTLAATVTGVDGVENGMSKNLGNYMLLFGFNRQPTDDLIFRKAVYYALDHALLATSIGGQDGEVPGAGLIPSLSIGFDASLPANVRDLDEANRLLDEGGYLDVDGDGFQEMPDGTEMDVLLSPTYNATRQPPGRLGAPHLQEMRRATPSACWLSAGSATTTPPSGPSTCAMA